MCFAPIRHSNRELRAYLEGIGLSVQALPVAAHSAGDQPMGRAHLCSSNAGPTCAAQMQGPPVQLG